MGSLYNAMVDMSCSTRYVIYKGYYTHQPRAMSCDHQQGSMVHDTMLWISILTHSCKLEYGKVRFSHILWNMPSQYVLDEVHFNFVSHDKSFGVMFKWKG